MDDSRSLHIFTQQGYALDSFTVKIWCFFFSTCGNLILTWLSILISLTAQPESLKEWFISRIDYIFYSTGICSYTTAQLIPWSERNWYISCINLRVSCTHAHTYTHCLHTTRFEVATQVCWSSDCDVHALVSGMHSILYTAVLCLAAKPTIT